MRPPRLRPRLLVSRQPINIRRCFSSSPESQETVELAYDLHVSENCKNDPKSCNGPIIFMHGLFGSKTNNRSMSKLLAKDLDRPVYAVDLRNHGTSPHTRTHDYTHLALDVEAFITQHSLTKPTLIGHSMGAKTAMTIALRQPSEIANLIVVDNAPVDAALKSDFHGYVKGMQAVERAQVTSQKQADELLKPYAKVWDPGWWWPTELAVRQFLLTNLIRPKRQANEPTPPLQWRIPLAALTRSLDLMGDFPFRDPEDARFTGPTLIVRGTKSPYVADEALPVAGRFFPRFELADIEAGHWLISENPEAFRRVVVEFLKDKE